MSTPKRNLRQLFSRRAREERRKEQKGFFAFLWEAAKKGVEGSVGNAVKWILGIIVVSGGGWLVNEFFVNPWENISIEGYVMEYDKADKPLVGATVFVVGRRDVEFETDAQGRYAGQLKVRKKDKTLLLSCDYPGYDFFQKPVDIPVDKPKTIRTDFHLQPH